MNSPIQVKIGPAYVYGVFDNIQLSVEPLSSVAGDYNNNGVVDAADYIAWREGGTSPNEVATPGTATAEDYAAWRARFGNSSANSANSATVPEPASTLIVALAGLTMIFATARFSNMRDLLE